MEITPSGILSEPMKNLGDMIAATTAFQTWTETADATEAAAHIEYIAEDAGDLQDRFVVILGSSNYELEGVGQGLGFSYQAGGTIGLRFEALIPARASDLVATYDNTVANTTALMALASPAAGDTAYQTDARIGHTYNGTQWVEIELTHANVVMWFMNSIGAILEGMSDLSGTSGYFTIHGFIQAGEITRSSEDEAKTDGDRLQLEIDVRWGP
jgi:hypothetical protein